MGNYVYLYDNEMDYISRAISNKDLDDRMLGPEDAPPSETYLNIQYKLRQKPKTLEDYNYILTKDEYIRESDSVYFDTYSNKIKIGDKIDLYYAYTLEELEAILNKAKELFKEKKNDNT